MILQNVLERNHLISMLYKILKQPAFLWPQKEHKKTHMKTKQCLLPPNILVCLLAMGLFYCPPSAYSKTTDTRRKKDVCTDAARV